MKKSALAILGVFVAWSVMDFVLHGMILQSSYAATVSLWRPMGEMKMSLMYITVFISAAAFVLIYSLFFSRKGISTGWKYGLLFGLSTGVPMGYGSYSVMPIPYHMAFIWCFGSVVEAMVGGLIIGSIIRDEKERSALNVRINASLLATGVILLACVTWVLNEIGGERHESPLALVAHAGDRLHHSVSFTFDGTPESAFPQDFQAGMTGEWKKTEWSIHKVEGNAVLAHVGFWEEDPDGVFPVAWVKDSKARDLRLAVRLFPVHPPPSVERAVHDGAGIVVRFMDPDNYYLLRSVPHETRVRFYKVENGKRSTLAGKDIDVPTGQWHELQLTARGSTFTAHFNGEKLFAHEDKTFEEAGAFGLWCKPNNVTYFDDLKADIFD